MTRRRLLVLILLAYLAITLAYGALNPLFEAPDEHWHFFTAASVADTGRLPRVSEPPDEWLGQEAAQPPLYYLLGGALIAPIDTDGAREAVWLNPFAWVGDASALANVNRVVHTAAEAWPWRGYVLAAHVLRVFSTLLGLGTLLAIYGSARRLWPEARTRPLMATALVAFLPQFNFVHASITNDALITFLCSLALYQLIRLWRMDEEKDKRLTQRSQRSAKDAMEDSSWRSLRGLLLLGITIGLAALSKNAGVLLLAYSLGFLALLALRDGRRRDFWRTALLVALPALVLAVPLWARNQSLYGDWTATAPFIAIAGGDRGYSLWQALGVADGLLVSLVGVFGWFNLRPPAWVQWVWLAVVVLAALGALGCVWRGRAGGRRGQGSRGARERGGKSAAVDGSSSPVLPRPPAPLHANWFLALLLAAWPLLVYAGLLSFMTRTEAAQGRLLFPGILPLALGVAWGLRGWGSCMPRWLGSINRRLSPLVALAALATTVYCLMFVIRPAYQTPLLVGGLPEDTVRVLPELTARGGGLGLLGARVETETVRPGEVVWLTLYWRADEAPAEVPEFVLEVFGRDVDRIANLHSYHGRGLYPATLWPPGAIVADRFAVRIDPDAAAPVLARVFARVDGGEPGIEVATVRVVPHEPPPAPDAWQAELGDPDRPGTHIALVSAAIVPEQARPGQVIRIDVRWYVPRGRPERDYTTLIHLGQPDSPPLATGDSPPLDGSFPTGAWANGETIDDDYRLTMPADLSPGRYPIWIGMYDPATGQRLPVTVEGERQPNGVYLAGWVEVVCPAGNADCGD